ncbi:actin-related protein 5 [Nematocida major]|uniref:actin-related protein 5 n=1 Tax=Nematocida major TaxID=1912982 RepID=UPI00200767D6|nr:actin-related protein 5 [Nematocida major]KAH9387263.1 actin-related protein 5 [Nematocida major]
MKKTLLVIDNGSWECRAGISSDSPTVRFRNQIHRVKGKDGKTAYSLLPNKKPGCTSTVKSMFDGSVIYNYEVFEGTLKEILRETRGKSKEKVTDVVITECFLNPQMFQDMAIRSIFSTIPCETVRIGYDFIFAYEHNMKHNKEMVLEALPEKGFCDVIISMGYLGVYVVPVDPTEKKILYEESTFLQIGGLAAQHIFYRSISNKYCGTGIKVVREEVEEYFSGIRVSCDYSEEVEKVVNDGLGNVKVSSRAQKPKEKKVPDKRRSHFMEIAKRRQSVTPQEATEDLPESTPGDPESAGDLPREEKEKDAQEEEEALLRRLKREKLIKGATDHRNKQKIMKALERLSMHISALESEHLLICNPEEYMRERRERLQELEARIKRRTFVRNELKNRKSPHSLSLLKKSLEQPDSSSDNPHLQEIRDAAEDDTPILEEIDAIEGFLRGNDSSYTEREENPLDKIRHGYGEKGGVNINVEFIRTPESLFSPSIVGVEQPGLRESLFAVFQRGSVRNIFITGGFSQIAGLKERIEKEVLSLRYLPNSPRVITAMDPVNDAYAGGFLESEFFPKHTRGGAE